MYAGNGAGSGAGRPDSRMGPSGKAPLWAWPGYDPERPAHAAKQQGQKGLEGVVDDTVPEPCVVFPVATYRLAEVDGEPMHVLASVTGGDPANYASTQKVLGFDYAAYAPTPEGFKRKE